MFSTLSKTNFAILVTFKLSSANALNLEVFILLFGKEFGRIRVIPFPTEKSLQTTILNFMKMTEISPGRKKTLWGNETLLVTSNVSFSHSVFKGLVLQTRKNQGLFGKEISIHRV